MQFRDIGLALITVLIWGTNFIAMKFGLEEMPPLFFVALRFFLVSFPLVFFLPFPKTHWLKVFGIGFFMSAMQFGFLFYGMRNDITAGLASIVLQFQVPLTILLSALVLNEPAKPNQIIGVLIAGIGFIIFAVSSGGNMTSLGLIMTLIAALSWACGNLILRRISGVKPLNLVVWAGLVPILPLSILSYIIEDQHPWHILTSMSMQAWLSVLYVAILSSLIGYTIWTKLFEKYSAGMVAPFALLVPVIGLFFGALILNESLSQNEMVAVAFVFSGLVISVLGGRVYKLIMK